MKYLQKFLQDRRGVTPVVGVILMVAVTVVMGAVIAGFVYGYVGTTQKGPLVGISVTDDPETSNSFMIKHTGGEEIVQGDWKLSVTAGKDAGTKFEFAGTALDPLDVIDAEGGDVTDATINAGRTLKVVAETTGDGLTTGTAITTTFYHVVIVHAPSNSLLLDTNVQVR